MSGGKGSSGDVGFNYTPLIDVTFNIIIFFVLTTEITQANLAKIDPPHPQASVAQPRARGINHTLVNVVTEDPDGKDPIKANTAKHYEVDMEVVQLTDYPKLVSLFKDRKTTWKPLAGEVGTEFYIEIRSDKRVGYGAIQPILLAAKDAGIKKISLTAKYDEKDLQQHK